MACKSGQAPSDLLEITVICNPVSRFHGHAGVGAHDVNVAPAVAAISQPQAVAIIPV